MGEGGERSALVGGFDEVDAAEDLVQYLGLGVLGGKDRDPQFLVEFFEAGPNASEVGGQALRLLEDIADSLIRPASVKDDRTGVTATDAGDLGIDAVAFCSQGFQSAGAVRVSVDGQLPHRLGEADQP